LKYERPYKLTAATVQAVSYFYPNLHGVASPHSQQADDIINIVSMETDLENRKDVLTYLDLLQSCDGLCASFEDKYGVNIYHAMQAQGMIWDGRLLYHARVHEILHALSDQTRGALGRGCVIHRMIEGYGQEIAVRNYELCDSHRREML
jgi:hypothetical protein